MTEKELYDRVAAIASETEALCDAVMQMPPTIELCMFTGMLNAASSVLDTIVQAGVPAHSPDEEPHPLKR